MINWLNPSNNNLEYVELEEKLMFTKNQSILFGNLLEPFNFLRGLKWDIAYAIHDRPSIMNHNEIRIIEEKNG